MAETNATVNVDVLVEDKLKLAAECFAIKVFQNPAIGEQFPDVLYAAVAIYKRSAANKTSIRKN